MTNITIFCLHLFYKYNLYSAVKIYWNYYSSNINMHNYWHLGIASLTLMCPRLLLNFIFLYSKELLHPASGYVKSINFTSLLI